MKRGEPELNLIATSDQLPAEAAEHVEKPAQSAFSQYFVSTVVVAWITLVCLLLQLRVGYRAIALIYLLGVVVMALFAGRGPVLFAAALSALSWDYFFLAPISHFRITNVEDASMFVMYFVVALVLGQLTSRISAQERARRQGEERATALYLLSRKLARAADFDQLLRNVVQQTERAFDAQIVLLLPDAAHHLSYHAHAASTYEIPGPEQPVAEWAFEQGKPAGKFTDHKPRGDALYLPLVTGGRRLGVIGLRFNQSATPSVQQRNLLNAFQQQIALALEWHRLREESEHAKRLAESERLSKTLLNSMSHEIRTPIAAIQSATSNLIEIRDSKFSAPEQAMISEIQEATERLNRVVGKVLDATRLESGTVTAKRDLCDVIDLVSTAVKDTRKDLSQHKVSVELAPALPLVRMDFVLMQQALINLLSNVAFHTPPGTAVSVSARIRDRALVLAVADRGRGIPAESLARIFDKFYRAPTAPTGGTGLGLSLVKGFVEAQGGEVAAENRTGGGAVFTIRLPLEHNGAGSNTRNL